ncbi:MAG TPA: hypothetical protein VL334_00475 [Anaerolineae bacterium]|jgi:pilus assembly protein TadC|nr:hypothetical protein [Anaerolineae bacterium]
MSDLQTLTLGVAGLAGAGTWLLLLTLGQTLVGLVGRVRLYRRTRAEQQLARYRAVMPATVALPDHVLYGYPDLSWQALGLGLAVVGILALLPVLGFPGALVAVVLERAPHLVRGQLVREGRARLRLRIRDFVDDLREAVAIHGSLGKALDALVATQGERADAVALALARRARSRSAQLSADQVLDGMAADLKSPDMREVAAQVRLALAGGMDLAEALSAVAETLSEVIAAEVNVRLQAAPNTYVLPMVLFMFGPLLILMLYPVALRVVALITGGA